MNRIKVQCEFCGSLIARSNLGRHSNKCANEHSKPKRTPRKIEEISTLTKDGKYSCNACNKEYTRQGISTHFWLQHGDGEKHLVKVREWAYDLHEAQRGRPSWNSGLTAEIDERVRQAKENLVNRIKSGNIKYVGKKHTKEMREHLSQRRSEFLNTQGNGGFKTVKWYPTIDSFGEACSLRGTWEVMVSEWLNKKGVMWSRKHVINYYDGEINRTYSPDFFIPSDNLIIEVKGYFSDRDKKKMKFVQDQNPDLKIKYITSVEIEHLDSIEYI